jgi:hypothetical protein
MSRTQELAAGTLPAGKRPGASRACASIKYVFLSAHGKEHNTLHAGSVLHHVAALRSGTPLIG